MLQVLFFKLEEEELALFLHLPKVFAETTVLGSASSSGCRLVVATVQVAEDGKATLSGLQVAYALKVKAAHITG